MQVTALQDQRFLTFSDIYTHPCVFCCTFRLIYKFVTYTVVCNEKQVVRHQFVTLDIGRELLKEEERIKKRQLKQMLITTETYTGVKFQQS